MLYKNKTHKHFYISALSKILFAMSPFAMILFNIQENKSLLCKTSTCDQPARASLLPAEFSPRKIPRYSGLEPWHNHIFGLQSICWKFFVFQILCRRHHRGYSKPKSCCRHQQTYQLPISRNNLCSCWPVNCGKPSGSPTQRSNKAEPRKTTKQLASVI